MLDPWIIWFYDISKPHLGVLMWWCHPGTTHESSLNVIVGSSPTGRRERDFKTGFASRRSVTVRSASYDTHSRFFVGAEALFEIQKGGVQWNEGVKGHETFYRCGCKTTLGCTGVCFYPAVRSGAGPMMSGRYIWWHGSIPGSSAEPEAGRRAQ